MTSKEQDTCPVVFLPECCSVTHAEAGVPAPHTDARGGRMICNIGLITYLRLVTMGSSVSSRNPSFATKVYPTFSVSGLSSRKAAMRLVHIWFSSPGMCWSCRSPEGSSGSPVPPCAGLAGPLTAHLILQSRHVLALPGPPGSSICLPSKGEAASVNTAFESVLLRRSPSCKEATSPGLGSRMTPSRCLLATSCLA